MADGDLDNPIDEPENIPDDTSAVGAAESGTADDDGITRADTPAAAAASPAASASLPLAAAGETGMPDSTNQVPSRRRWPKRLAIAVIVLLVATAGGLGWLAWDNAERANDWEQIALDTRAELDDTEDTLAATEDELDEANGRIEALDDRVAGLAAEKAQVATEREFFQTQQELFAGLSMIGDSAITKLGNCLSAQQDVTVAVFDLTPGDPLFYMYLDIFQSTASRADSICDGAVNDVMEFRGLLDEMFAAI